MSQRLDTNIPVEWTGRDLIEQSERWPGMFWKPELKWPLQVTVLGTEGARNITVSEYCFYGPRDRDTLVAPSGKTMRLGPGDKISLASGAVLEGDGFTQGLGRLGYLVEKNPERCAALRRTLAKRDGPQPGFLLQAKWVIRALLGKEAR